jgi:predicted metal-dependent HD superfamily phosphohydrolase
MDRKEWQRRIERLTYVVADLMPKLPYHNFKHAMDVYSAANTLALLEKVNPHDRHLVKTAGLLHDIIQSGKGHEERCAEFARQYLPNIGYSLDEAREVGRLILPTKMPQKPSDLLERIICDADLYNLGGLDFFQRGEELRKEFGLPSGEKWYQTQLDFLQSHIYHTETARRLRDSGKRANIAKLKELLGRPEC